MICTLFFIEHVSQVSVHVCNAILGMRKVTITVVIMQMSVFFFATD